MADSGPDTQQSTFTFKTQQPLLEGSTQGAGSTDQQFSVLSKFILILSGMTMNDPGEFWPVLGTGQDLSDTLWFPLLLPAAESNW